MTSFTVVHLTYTLADLQYRLGHNHQLYKNYVDKSWPKVNNRDGRLVWKPQKSKFL